MFQLVRLRSEVARVRRHMEEKGQLIAHTKGASAGSDADSDEEVMPGAGMHMEEG